MLRFLTLTVLFCSCIAIPAPQLKKNKIYKLNAVIGADNTEITNTNVEETEQNNESYINVDDNQSNLDIGEKREDFRRKKDRIREHEEYLDHQNKNAHYSFDSAVHDDINDHSIVRTEQREGKKVTGMYSYSDGFFLRTVHYEADENGYRVVKEEQEKIGEGPEFNPEGRADVEGSLIGQYSIQVDNRKSDPHYVGINFNGGKQS